MHSVETNGIASTDVAETEISSVNEQERTLILIKPDAVRRQIVGTIISRFEKRGLKIVGMKLFKATEAMVADHYVEHKNEHFFGELIDRMTRHPLIVMVWQGPNVIRITRNMLGRHDPAASIAGTIRADFSTDTRNNVIHGSDSVNAAHREINIWFQQHEIAKMKFAYMH